MASFWPYSLFNIAVLAGIAAVVAYRLRSASFKRTVLTGNAGLFEDSPDNSGERRSFSYRTDAEGKRWFVMDSLVRPGMAGALPGKSASPPLHIHPAQQECFLVRRGHFAFVSDGREGLVVGGTPEAAQPVCIPPGRPHTFWNAKNTTELDMEVTLEPPLNAEQFFRTVTGLALDYGSLGNAPLPQLLSTFVGGGVALADMPRPLWRLVETVIVPYVFEGALGTRPFPY